MLNSKAYLGLSLAAVLAFAIGCQPEPNRNSRKFGRNAYGSPGQRPTSTGGDAIVNAGGDAQMTIVAAQLAAPALNSNPEWRLGQVSARTGVKLWAEVYAVGTGGSADVDPKRSRIHIEVADSRVGQADGVGGKLDPFTLHIGYDMAGYRGAEGGITGNTVALRFDQDGYGSVLVVGMINGNTFTGDVSFVNSMTDNAQTTLGSFSMQTCAFFYCQ